MPGGGPPRVVPVARGVSLVVADVPQASYAPSVLEPRLADAEWVSAAAAAHHASIERLARTQTVVPFRLFTIFSSDARARQTTVRNVPRLRRALARLAGREEWVLRIGPHDPARLAAATRGGAAKSSPASGTHFLRQKAAAVRERRARADRVASDAADVVRALEAVADGTSVRPAPPGTAVLVDAAFLVPKPRRAGFRRALQAHAAPLLAEGCAISLTGPWPPYSFASIE
jgi:hypothetical protein